ncbi:MAG: redox-sensing transcriptional repressor Rex [Chloroflexota bacterium]
MSRATSLEAGDSLVDGLHHIPDIVIRRMPIYVRTLRSLAGSGVETVSSDELADLIGVSAAQIRRDLASFGRFGRQGKGYPVAELAETVEEILHLDRRWDVGLAGYGNIGRAIAHHRDFLPTFRIAAIFDRRKHGQEEPRTGLRILPPEAIADEVARLGIELGIIAVPADAAQGVADQMIAGGVRALLNYAPVVLRAPGHVVIREVDPVAALRSLTYYLDPAPAADEPGVTAGLPAG